MALSNKQIKIGIIGFVGVFIFLIVIPSILVKNNAELIQLEQKCLYNTDKSLEDFRTAIEKTVQNKTPSLLNFNPLGCFEDEQFIILITDDESLCKRTCMTDSSVCILLRYDTSEVTGIQDKCLNIPYDTQFRHVGDGTESCQEIEGYKKAEMLSGTSQGIILGSYYFVYYDNPAINYPIVCSYLED